MADELYATFGGEIAVEYLAYCFLCDKYTCYSLVLEIFLSGQTNAGPLQKTHGYTWALFFQCCTQWLRNLY